MFEKSLHELTFADVVAFCAKKYQTTVQLDYVSSFEAVDLPRRIAALANTFGGDLIIGVSPNARTGRPTSYRGVRDDARFGEQLARCMRAVHPYPHCTFHKTTNKNGRVFVLIHVHEGRYGPYYVSGEPQTVWIRLDGRNVLTPATRTDILQIRNKHPLKEQTTHCTEPVFSLLHAEAEVSREAARTPDDGSVYTPGLLEDMPLLTMRLCPRHATSGLLGVTPQLLQQWVPELRPTRDTAAYVPHFPESHMEAIPDGVATLQWCDTPEARDVHCDQLYTDGTAYHAHSILQYVDAEPAIYLTTVTMELSDFLSVAQRLYVRAGYHGTLEGSISITQASGMQVISSAPPNYPIVSSSIRTVPFASHTWPLLTDTYTLADPHTSLSFCLSLIEKIHWDMRASGYVEEQVHAALWQTGRTTLPPPDAAGLSELQSLQSYDA